MGPTSCAEELQSHQWVQDRDQDGVRQDVVASLCTISLQPDTFLHFSPCMHEEMYMPQSEPGKPMGLLRIPHKNVCPNSYISGGAWRRMPVTLNIFVLARLKLYPLPPGNMNGTEPLREVLSAAAQAGGCRIARFGSDD